MYHNYLQLTIHLHRLSQFTIPLWMSTTSHVFILICDVIFLVLSIERLYRLIDDLVVFCDLKHLKANLSKTTVMAFIVHGDPLWNITFSSKVMEIEITTSFAYFRLISINLRLSFRQVFLPWLSKGYGFLSILVRQNFTYIFMIYMPNYTILMQLSSPKFYNSQTWGLSLIPSN